MEGRRHQPEIEGAAFYQPDEVSEDQVTELVRSSVAALRDISPISGNNNIVLQNCQINIDITNVRGSRRDTRVTAVSNNSQSRTPEICYFSPFAVLKLELCDKLVQADIRKLVQYFRLESLVAEGKDLSALKFVEILEQRNMFSAREVDRLLEGLLTIENGTLFAIVAGYQNNCVAIKDQPDSITTPADVPRIQAPSSSEMEVNPHPTDDNQEGGDFGDDFLRSNDIPDTSSRPNIIFPIAGDQSPLCDLQLIIEEESTAGTCSALEKNFKDIVWSASGCLDHLTNVFIYLLNSYGPLIEITDTDGIKFHLGVSSVSRLESLQEDVTDGSLAEELLQLLLPDEMNTEMEKSLINMSVKLDPDSLQKLHSYLISQTNDDEENIEGLCSIEFFCDYCKVYFEEEWQHHDHIHNNDDHKKKIASKQGNETWREREPPLTATNGSFKYCENVADKSCEYMGMFGIENKCPFAHTSRELKEWKKRHEHRLKIIQRMSDQSENLFTFRSSKKGLAKESKRWTDMIAKINVEGDTLKSVGLIKYSKKEKIGTGSSGSHIFGGKFEHRYVAVKKIVNETVQREKELFHLMKTKAMSNILKILHVEEDEDFTYVVTNLCEYDLKDVIEEKGNPVGDNLTPEKRVKLCVDILRGLKDLHSIDVIHRDLKPNNILVDVNGDAFVADFGISRNLIGATTHLTSGYGTLCWIAYESSQSINDKVRYKKESDVQVAGCLIYYILSNGHHPFEATSPFINDTGKLMSNVKEGNFSLLHVENYPDQCTALLKRMLDQDISKRPRIDDCLKEMEAVRKSYISSTKKNTLTNDDITLSMEDVNIACKSDFVKYLPGKNLRKKQKMRWILHVKCTYIQLAKVFLWHSQSENFSLSPGGQLRQQELDVKDIQKDSEGTYIFFVDFESTTRGAFHQWLILDFGYGKVLCQQFLVWVGPEYAGHFQTDDDTTLWDLSNHEVVKFPCSFEPDPLYEKLEEKYPLPEETSGFPTAEQLTRNNFQEYFHEMVFDEERARIKRLKQFNGFQEMDLKERIDENVWVKPPTGQLFGEIKWKVRLDDSEASQIVTSSVQLALLKFEGSSETVYEAEIVAGIRLDLREFDRFVVTLSPQCVADQKLRSGVKVSVNVQFKVDRKTLCRYHYAIDNLKAKNVLFPPRDMFPRFLEEESTNKNDDYSLNHRQEETRKFISVAKHAVPFRQGPSLIIGPFGTGKTLTLARTVVDILELDQRESKLLICTHSNSAADLFIHELRGGCKQNMEFHLLRVYATERDPGTVEEVIRERYSNFDFMGNRFIKPNAEEVSRCHVVVTTLATSIHFIDLPQLRGVFTHIFIDEAGQALETETMIPLGLAGPRTVVVLAGDHKQMRPKIFSRKAQKCNFQRSMLERLFYWSKRNNCNNFHFLTDNYRILSPEILAFIGEHCYHVKNFATAKSKDQQLASTTSTYPSMVFSAVSGEDKLQRISYYNEKEAEEIVQQVLELKKNWPSEWGDFTEKSIAVLSPYKLQVQLLRSRFRKKLLHSVNVHTVQNSQGQQFKVVFISTVRTRHTICKDEIASPSSFKHDPDYYGVLSDEGELITALTRARSLLWVVGDPISLCSVGKCQKIWKEYIQACVKLDSLKPPNISWPEIEEELAALMCTTPPIEEEDESNVSADSTLYSRCTAEHIEPLQSTSSQDCDTDTEFEDIDDVIFDEIISELEKEVEKELSRKDSESSVEPEDTPQEVSEEAASRPQPSKSGRKKRRFKFRMLQDDEISLVKIDYKLDHSRLEGGYDSEVEEESEEMDEARKARNIQLTIDCPDEYCTAVLQFAENNLVHAIPLTSRSHDKIVVSSKRKRKRALDGDQVVLRKWNMQNVTYGEVMCILKRAEDLKWKKIVCSLDSENLGLMCPVDNPFLPKMFIYPHGIKKTGSEGAVTIGLYSINPHKRRKIQHEKNVVVKSTEMANKLFVVHYLKWFDDCPYPMGIVTEELPPCNSLDVGLRVLRLKHCVREKWPASVMDEMKQYSEKWKIPKPELKKRTQYDFRGKHVFTLGHSDLSDRDFAIHVEELQDGKIELGLHLSDVPFFIEKDSSLDREVLQRGASFFTTLRNSSHMLPNILSTNLCIFQQNKDRLSVSIVLTLDKNLQMENVVFCRSLVCCKQNLTFEEVENFILNKYDPHFEFKREVMQQVEMLYKVLNRLPQIQQSLHGAEIEDQINFPLACSLVEGIRKLANVHVTKKLKSLSEYKIPVCHQLPPKEEDSRLWYQTFEEDAHRIPHLPASLCYEAKKVSYKQPIPVLQSTWEELGHILDNGKDKMLELQNLLSCNEGFPRRVAALANLNDITPQEEFISTSAGSNQLGLQHFSRQEDCVHPFMAPVRSCIDLVVLRMLVASLEEAENPYSNDDISHIAYHCTKQTQSAKKYKKKAQMLVFAFKAKVIPHQLQAVIHSATEEELMFCYSYVGFLKKLKSSTTVPLRLLKPGKRPGAGEVEGKSLKLNWKNRIYSYEGKMPEVTDNKSTFWLFTNKNVKNIPAQSWEMMFQSVEQKAHQSLEDLENDWNQVNQRNTDTSFVPTAAGGELVYDITCEKMKTERGSSEIRKYVQFNRQYNPGDVVDLQLCSGTEQGLLVPRIQLFKMTAKHDLCLEHRSMPVSCFTEMAEKMPLRCDTIEEYVETWLPMLRMMIAYNTIMSDETILIQDVTVKWSEENLQSSREIYGHFSLEKKWCDDRQIIFSIRPKKKKDTVPGFLDPTEKFLLSDFICVRVHGQKVREDQLSQLEKFGSKQNVSLKTEVPIPETATIVVHGVSGVTNIGKPAETENYEIEFQVTQTSSTTKYLFDGNAEQNQDVCTVELITKPEPEKRMEVALANVKSSSDLIRSIVLQNPEDIAKSVDGRALNRLIEEGRKIDDKSFRDFFEQQPPNESQTEALKKALTQPFTVIQGPPGTGKTRTGAYLTSFFAQINRKVYPRADPRPQILYCGPSNKSVDVIALYLQKFQKRKLRFVRVYSDSIEQQTFPIPGIESAERKFTSYVEDAHMAKEIQMHALHHIIRSSEAGRNGTIIRGMDKRFKEGKLEPIQENVRKYKEIIRNTKIAMLKARDIILCTCNAAGHFILKENLNIIQCIIDEAGMCFELDNLIPMVSQQPKQVVLIGDHKQLRPIIQNPRAKQLGAEISLMEKFKEEAFTLKIQYRMHEEICKFPSQEFYEDKLKTDESVRRRQNYVARNIWPGDGHHPRVFCHIEGEEDTLTVRTSDGNELSKSNLIEAKEVVRIAKCLIEELRVHEDNVVILSQYNLQCKHIRDKLKESRINVKVQTIIKSQGSEWDFVLLSTVRSLPEDEIPRSAGKSWRRKNLGFIEDENQMNVGLTRAMRGLIIVGNKNLLVTCHKWKKLIQHYQTTKSVVPAESFLRLYR